MQIGQTFNPFGLFNGIFIPEGIAAATTILPGAKLAYGRLLRYAGRDGNCYPAVPTLAKEIGVKVRQCQNYLSELEGLGLIRRIKRIAERGDQTSNAFEFLWHPLLGAVHQATPAPVQPSPPPMHASTPPVVQASAPKESQVLRDSRFNKEPVHSKSSEAVVAPYSYEEYRKDRERERKAIETEERKERERQAAIAAAWAPYEKAPRPLDSKPALQHSEDDDGLPPW